MRTTEYLAMLDRVTLELRVIRTVEPRVRSCPRSMECGMTWPDELKAGASECDK